LFLKLLFMCLNIFKEVSKRTFLFQKNIVDFQSCLLSALVWG
jgi:hypothetical protein